MDWIMRRSVLALAVLSLVLAACGSGTEGDDEGDTDTTEAPGSSPTTEAAETDGRSHEEASVAELEVWQTDLNAVGCYVGQVDGSLGPKTKGAIEAFQAAQGLTVDGLLGPRTEEALQEAVAAGEIVCSSSTDTAADGGAVASLSSPSYGPIDFVVGQCTSSGESDIALQGEVDNLTLVVEASEAEGTEDAGAGILSVDGGTESDGITLEGRVESIVVGDVGNFTVTGVFGPPNLEGEEFELTGSCA